MERLRRLLVVETEQVSGDFSCMSYWTPGFFQSKYNEDVQQLVGKWVFEDDEISLETIP